MLRDCLFRTSILCKYQFSLSPTSDFPLWQDHEQLGAAGELLKRPLHGASAKSRFVALALARDRRSTRSLAISTRSRARCESSARLPSLDIACMSRIQAISLRFEHCPRVVEVQGELDALRVREKVHTREGDGIAAARRRLPIIETDGATPLIGEFSTG